MKICYINVIEENHGWGAEFFVNRGFLENGHHTVTLDYRRHRHRLCGRFLELPDFDVLFLQRGDYFPMELLRAVQRPRFFWASELVSRNRDQDRLLSSGLFEHVFVHSARCQEEVVRRGWLPESRVSVLLNGFDETVHCRKRGVEQDIEVLFLGHVLPRRRAWLDRLREEVAVTEVNAFGAEMTAYLNRAKIVLNIHAEEYTDTETRVFEALGCGAFLLTERLSVDSPFTPGDHLVQVDDPAGMARAIRYYLHNGEERERIAESGWRASLAAHSYRERAREIAAVFDRYLHPDDAPATCRARVQGYRTKETVLRQLYRLTGSRRWLA